VGADLVDIGNARFADFMEARPLACRAPQRIDQLLKLTESHWGSANAAKAQQRFVMQTLETLLKDASAAG
jgi:hypothetical protein